MWTRATLKENGKIAFKRNLWTCIAACLVVGFLGGESYGAVVSSGFSQSTVEVEELEHSISGISQQQLLFASIVFLVVFGVTMIFALAFSILVGNIMTVGGRRYFMENRQHRTEIGQVFYGFRNGRYSHVVWTMFLRGLYTFLWSLLFFIPGIIKSYSYMMVPYILAENPHMDANRAITLSRKMMDGHKAEAFVIGLSFIGWNLLGIMTFGILNIVYVCPYMNATYAEFYAAVKGEAIYKGLAAPEELPGFYEEKSFNL